MDGPLTPSLSPRAGRGRGPRSPDLSPGRRVRGHQTTYAGTALSAHLRPRGLDPVCRRSRLVVGRARLWPAERRRNVTDRDRDDPVGIPGGKFILRQVLAEAGHRVLIGLVIGPHVQIARR